MTSATPLNGAQVMPLNPFELESDSVTSLRVFEVNGYATPQWSPGARLKGSWIELPSAGGVGWRAGLTIQGGHKRWKWEGTADHWRVAGVHESDWNEAWQWGVWDGMGYAWNPNGADIAIARVTGSVSYQVSPSVALDLGKNQHHWGKGWRSLWHDRQAAALPYARLSANAGKVHYTHLIGSTMHLGVGSPPALPSNGRNNPGTYTTKKRAWMASHVVDVELGRGWNAGLFGAVTWLHADSGYSHRFEPAYALPFIAFRPTEYAIGSADNALIGASLEWIPRFAKKQVLIYGQLLFDEMVVSELLSSDGWWANKWSVLGSIQWRSSNEHWFVVLEASGVRPYTYSHASSSQSWTHQNQPLAHPGGSNFVEGRFHVQWKNNRWSWHTGAVYMRKGIDESSELGMEPSASVGSNPLLSYTTRPEEYGIDWIYDGNGLVGDAGIQNVARLWMDLGYALPQLGGQEAFVRGMMRKESGAQADQAWWRLEVGIRVNRVFEERNW